MKLGPICVTTLDDERAADWQRVFGAHIIPITSSEPEPTLLEHVGPVLCFFVDLASFTAAEHAHIAHCIAEQFELPLASVTATLDRDGVPLPATDDLYVIVDRDPVPSSR